MYHCCSGMVANWCFTDGHQEGNHSSFSDGDDLYVGWWILCAESSCIQFMAPLCILQLPYLQTPTEGAVWPFTTISLHVTQLGSGVEEVATLNAMVFAYRFLAYISLRRMKLSN
ncbi:unnamed protein product [Musa banksii]